MAYWIRYRKLLLILCVWGVAGSAYFFWHSLQGRHVLMAQAPPVLQPHQPGGSTLASGARARPLQAATTKPLHSATPLATVWNSAGTKPPPGSVQRDSGTTSLASSSRPQTSPQHSWPSVAPAKSATTSKMATVSANVSRKTSSWTPDRHPSITPSDQHPSVRPPDRHPSITPSDQHPSVRPPDQHPSITPSDQHPSITPPDQHPSVRPSASPQLLCVRFSGRLGNELFEYASTLGLALTLKRTPVFLGSLHLASALSEFRVSPSSLAVSTLEQRCSRAPLAEEDSCCKFKEQLTRLPPGQDYRVSVYLQSYRYFHAHRAHILQALRFNSRIQSQAGNVVRALRRAHQGSTLVGVHIRHGDMATPHFQRVGYPLASPAYINRSLSFFWQLHPGCVFVVASDSPDWCRQNFPPGYSVTFLAGNPPPVDMLVLSSLDHVVTSFGSFSWWIGFLSRGKVVYMKDFIRTNTYIGSAFNPKGKDYIYPGWTPL